MATQADMRIPQQRRSSVDGARQVPTVRLRRGKDLWSRARQAGFEGMGPVRQVRCSHCYRSDIPRPLRRVLHVRYPQTVTGCAVTAHGELGAGFDRAGLGACWVGGQVRELREGWG